MKKFAFVFLALAMIGLASLTLWSKRETEAAHGAWLRTIAAQPSVRLLESNYESGWVQSRSVTKLEVRGPLGENVARWLTEAGAEHAIGRVGVVWTDHITHGPLALWRGLREGGPRNVALWIESTVALDNEAQSDATAVLGRPIPALEVSSRFQVDGTLEARALLPASTHVLRRADDARVVLGAMKWQAVHGSVAATQGGWQATAWSEEFQLRREDGGSMAVAGWRADLQAANGRQGWTARLKTQADRFGWVRSGDPEWEGSDWLPEQLELSELRLEHIQEQETEGPLLTLRGRFGSGQLAGERLGEGNLDLELRTAGASESQDWGLARLGALLGGTPVIDPVSLEIETERGPLWLRGSLRTSEVWSRNAPHPLLAAAGLDVDFEWGGPAEVVRALVGPEERLAALERDGWLVASEGNLTGGIALERGVPVATARPAEPGTESTPVAEEAAQPQRNEAVAGAAARRIWAVLGRNPARRTRNSEPERALTPNTTDDLAEEVSEEVAAEEPEAPEDSELASQESGPGASDAVPVEEPEVMETAEAPEPEATESEIAESEPPAIEDPAPEEVPAARAP